MCTTFIIHVLTIIKAVPRLVHNILKFTKSCFILNLVKLSYFCDNIVAFPHLSLSLSVSCFLSLSPQTLMTKI